MTDDDLKRMLGMNAPLGTLSPVEIDALSHRIRALGPEHRLHVEAILRRDAQSDADLARILGRDRPHDDRSTKHPPGHTWLKTIKTFTLVFIAIHSFVVTLALLRLLHG